MFTFAGLERLPKSHSMCDFLWGPAVTVDHPRIEEAEVIEMASMVELALTTGRAAVRVNGSAPNASAEAIVNVRTVRKRGRSSASDKPMKPRKSSDSPLRRIRKRRGMTLRVLADRAGVSLGLLSMIENGDRKLSRIDHLIALSSVLQVEPSELIAAEVAAVEWHAPPGDRRAYGFAVIRDDFAGARHSNLTQELRSHILRGDARATGMWLRRIARDSSVDPWLLLDRFASQEIETLRRRENTGGGVGR